MLYVAHTFVMIFIHDFTLQEKCQQITCPTSNCFPPPNNADLLSAHHVIKQGHVEGLASQRIAMMVNDIEKLSMELMLMRVNEQV
jgi:hypothetical protein